VIFDEFGKWKWDDETIQPEVYTPMQEEASTSQDPASSINGVIMSPARSPASAPSEQAQETSSSPILRR